MLNKEVIATVTTELPPHYSEFKRVITVFFRRKLSAFGFTVIILLILTAIFAPQLAPYEPDRIYLKDKMQHPSNAHVLGTDLLGRDTLSRIIYGARTSLTITIVAVSLGALIGLTLGLIAAYFSGWIYTVIMRLIDALLTLPPILIALVIVAALGGGIRNLIIALAVAVIPVQARLMCAQALTIKQNDYILAGQVKGAGNLRIMLRHIVPNAFPPLLVMISIQLGTLILAEASLSFIGIGVEPPTATWGGMVSDGYKYLFSNPELSFAPGLAIMLVVFAFQMIGDGLRDALDPRLRGAF